MHRVSPTLRTAATCAVAILVATTLLVVNSQPLPAQASDRAVMDLANGTSAADAGLRLSPYLGGIAISSGLADVVTFDELQQARWMSADTIDVVLPDGTSLSFGRLPLEPSTAASQVWAGKNSSGTLTISHLHGLTSAAFQIEQGNFTLSPIDATRHLIHLGAPDRAVGNETPLRPIDAGFTGPDAPGGSSDETGGLIFPRTLVIDVMIGYDSASTALFGSDQAVEANFVATVDYANLVFSNTELPTRLDLVNMTKFNYSGTGDEFTELPRVAQGNDGHLDQIATIRNQVGADLVTMVTPIAGCGLAYVLTQQGAMESLGFNVIDPSCMTPNWPAYPHEIGHNLGAAHDPANAALGAHWPGGFGYIDQANGIATVMSYLPINGCCSYVDYFSNTNVRYNGIALGNAQRNNASAIRRNLFQVARYRIAAPSVPRNVRATPGNRSVTISWNEPETDRGEDVVSYYVVASPGGGNCGTGPYGLTCTIGNLTPGTQYTFSVTARNTAGTSPAGEVTAAPNGQAPPPTSSGAQFVTSSTSNNAGWVVRNGTKQWLNASCRTQLEDAGATFVIQAWNTIGPLSSTTARLTCDEMQQLIGGSGTGGNNGGRRFVTNSTTNAAGWVIANGTKQWLSPSCRAQLESQGVSFEILAWNQIGSVPAASNQVACGDLLSAPPPTGGGATYRVVKSTAASSGGFFLVDDDTNPTQQWITQACVNTLSSGGHQATVVPWRTYGNRTQAAPALSCANMLALLNQAT